ncbi:hypothetical protein ATANTOWER_031339, partial [Ataeniobius toweri]|nr:hypothetical protein [Ataeniobius toweri]
VLSVTRVEGADNPAEMVYFVEGQNGHRMSGVQTANLLNSLDVQRAAIILGYRVRGILAQPVEKVPSSPSDPENTNLWIIIGVVIPLLLVIIIISILYWKLCRTDKLEFQPDAMTTIQQRQKLQAPSVKGFDFAKLHLGQQSKDDVMVIQEPAPPGSGSGLLTQSIKDGLSPSENCEAPTPKSKTSASSTKASRRRERSVLLEVQRIKWEDIWVLVTKLRKDKPTLNCRLRLFYPRTHKLGKFCSRFFDKGSSFASNRR